MQLNGTFSVDESTKFPMTRILLDPIHGMWRVTDPISQKNPAKQLFCFALSDAIFQENPTDVAAVTRALFKEGVTFFDKKRNSPNWVSKRVRRKIPLPETLVANLEVLKAEFSRRAYDDDGGSSLLSLEALKQLDNLIAHAKKGCLSDPPGISMYMDGPRDRKVFLF
jgi:hypothetical protein